jgi:SNF2 family DNA or RNA helicase
MSCITRSNLPLNEHQKKVVDFLNKDGVRGLLVVHTVGTGKTLTSVTASQCFLDKYPNQKVVVITPTSLQGNFKKEMKSYGASSDDERYLFYTIQGFMSAFKNKKIKVSDFKDAMIIVDEAHNLRTKINIDNEEEENYAKTIIKFTKVAKKVMLLTATPFINRTSEIVNLISMIDGVEPISTSQFDHMLEEDIEKYFKCKISFYNPTTTSRDEFFPKMISEDVFLTMTPQYYQLYKRIEEKPTRSEFIFYNGVRRGSNSIEGIFSPKVNWIIKKIESSKPDQKFVVFSHYLGDGLRLLMSRLEKHNISFDHITGDVLKGKRDQTVKDYNQNRIKVLLISKAGGEGLDLSNTHAVIIMEPAWNEATHQQVIGRAIRFKSHYTLPKEQQKVYVYRLYHIKPNEKDIISKAVAKNWIINEDNVETHLSIDLYLRNLAILKQDRIQTFLKFVRKNSIEVKKCSKNEPYIIEADNTIYTRIKRKPSAAKSKKSKKTTVKSRKTATKSRKTATKSRKTATKSRKTATRSRKTATRSRKTATKSRKTAAKSRKTAAKSRKTATRSRKTAVRSRKTSTKSRKVSKNK